MKAKQIIKAAFAAVVLTIVGAQTVSAKSWRVNDNSTKKANFVDINAAMASAEVVAGDTLYLDPGFSTPSEQTITKPVTVIGTGYFLNNGMVSSTIGHVLHVKAERTKLIGVRFISDIQIYVNNVTIERCQTCYILTHYYINNIIVRQCYCTGKISYTYNSNYNFYNSIFENNIFITGNSCCLTHVVNSQINNNYFYNSSGSKTIEDVTLSSIYNNIIINNSNPNYNILKSEISHNNSVTNNVMSAAEGTYVNFPENVYLGSADTSVLFESGKTADAAYHLSEDSPAKGAANDGGDCGPYGGTTPYVESGLPLYHPYIKKAVVAGKSVNGEVDVELNIKMQNE